MAEMLDFDEFKQRYQEVPVEEYPNRVREAVPDPLLTVHLITYNHADYIRKAIESVLMQEVDFPMEIVLGDDDSSDGTREICMEYAEQHPDLIRLQLHHRENNHRLYGRPTHLFQYWYNTLSARGKYIAPLSGDDYWTDPRKIRQQISFLDSNPEYSFTHHNAIVTDGDGGVKKDRYFSGTNDEDIAEEELVQAPVVVASSVVFRNVIQGLPNQFMETLHEDRLITSLLGRYGKGKYFDEVMSAYRKHGSGIYDSSSEKVKYKEHKKFMSIIEKTICQNIVEKNKIKSKMKKVDIKMYTGLVKEKEYVMAMRSSIAVCHELIRSREPMKALRWMFVSLRFFLGHIKNSISK